MSSAANKSKFVFMVMILAYLSLGCPLTYLSQTDGNYNPVKKRTSKNRDNAMQIDISKKSLLKVNKDEKHQVKKITDDFIDLLFLQQNPEKAFKLYCAFKEWDDVDSDFIGESNFLKGVPENLGNDLNARISAGIWNYAFQEIYLKIGLNPILQIQEGEEIIQNPSEYESLFNSVIKQNNSTIPDFDFTGLSKEKIEERLSKIERDFKEVNNLIMTRIDQNLYNKNVEKMKNSIKIGKKIHKKKIYYVVEFLPSFSIIITEKNKNLKIIHLSGDIL